MKLKSRYNSFYYEEMTESEIADFDHKKCALLVIDMQNANLRQGMTGGECEGPGQEERWAPFRERLNKVLIPNIQKLENAFRDAGAQVMFARIASQRRDGLDRSLDQKMPGFNNLLFYKDDECAQIIPEIGPVGEELVFTKTTDSTVAGTNIRLILKNLGIESVTCCGILTDQCVSCTVRSLADESFYVNVVDDACAAATMRLHENELEIINHIYCTVLSTDEALSWTGYGLHS